MFALRGIAVSFSVFVIVYSVLSIAVGFTWRRVSLHIHERRIRRTADLLFAMRMLPLVAAAIITAAFTVPSFLLLEPRSISEPVGTIPLALGVCGALLALFGIVNAALALRRASHAISKWTSGAQPLSVPAPVSVLRISQTLPAMAAAGILRPRVFVSRAVEFVLTAGELQTALNHEVAHLNRRDNLKKLLLRFVAFPGMRGLEAAWIEATEMAADDAAVSNAGEALDLAAALIKLSRLGPVGTPVDLTAALVQSSVALMNARVERLVAWSSERRVPPQKYSPWYGLGAAAVTVAVFAVSYSSLLVHVHAATEWLVR
jgi:Zn-dependent protease with chaperone function